MRTLAVILLMLGQVCAQDKPTRAACRVDLRVWTAAIRSADTNPDREKISLDDFTKQVNERQGGSYEPFEFKTILEKLQMGRTINENRSLSDGPVAGRSKPRYKR